MLLLQLPLLGTMTVDMFILVGIVATTTRFPSLFFFFFLAASKVVLKGHHMKLIEMASCKHLEPLHDFGYSPIP